MPRKAYIEAEYRILSGVVGDRVGAGNHLLLAGASSAQATVIATSQAGGIRHLKPTSSIVPAIIPPPVSHRFTTHWRSSPVQGTLTVTAFGDTPVELQIVQPARLGTVTVTSAAEGKFQYQPSAATGMDYFVARAAAAGQTSAPLTVAYTVTNTAPSMRLAHFEVTATVGSTLNSTANGSDPDNDPLTYQMVALPAKGAVQLTAGTGEFSYTPNAGVSGQDTFTLRAFDQVDYSAAATVTVTLEQPQTPPPSDPPPSNPPANPPTSPPSSPPASSSGGGGAMHPIEFLMLALLAWLKRRQAKGSILIRSATLRL